MRVLHVTPHLGGGIGKAHAAISAVLPKEIERTYVLLEKPHDRRYLKAIEASGARVVVAGGLNTVAFHAGTADIVQFEYWNHPRMFECLARGPFLPMRSAMWCHNCGLQPPLFPAGLVQGVDRFVFSTRASLGIP